MFILDFDDTLFDSQAFRQSRFDAIKYIGVSKKEFQETYIEARNDSDGFFVYSNERHADSLSKIGYDKEEVLNILQGKSTSTMQDFLFPDTLLFLEKIKSFNEPMILLSLGNSDFQKLKIKDLGIDKYFKHLYFDKKSKKNILKKIFIEYDVTSTWFINDKIEETLDLNKQFCGMCSVLKICKKFDIKEYTQSNLPHFSSLTQIAQYVEKNR